MIIYWRLRHSWFTAMYQLNRHKSIYQTGTGIGRTIALLQIINRLNGDFESFLGGKFRMIAFKKAIHFCEVVHRKSFEDNKNVQVM